MQLAIDTMQCIQLPQLTNKLNNYHMMDLMQKAIPMSLANSAFSWLQSFERIAQWTISCDGNVRKEIVTICPRYSWLRTSHNYFHLPPTFVFSRSKHVYVYNVEFWQLGLVPTRALFLKMPPCIFRKPVFSIFNHLMQHGHRISTFDSFAIKLLG